MSELTEVERQYQPSVWSKRYPEHQVVDMHRQCVTKVSNYVKLTVPFQSGIKYGKRKGQFFDIFGENVLPTDAPIFVYIHGGYWQSFDRSISSYCVPPLYEAGVKVIVPDYDLAPEVSMKIIVCELKELAAFVLHLANQSGSRGVWFGGHSAGAHLAASLISGDWISSLTKDHLSKFMGLVLISGIYDLKPITETTLNNALKLTSEDVKRLSPMFTIDKNAKNYLCSQFSVIVAVAENDSPEFRRQSHDFSKVLTEHGFNAKYSPIPTVDHFDIVENLQYRNDILTKQIIQLITNSQT